MWSGAGDETSASSSLPYHAHAVEDASRFSEGWLPAAVHLLGDKGVRGFCKHLIEQKWLGSLHGDCNTVFSLLSAVDPITYCGQALRG